MTDDKNCANCRFMVIQKVDNGNELPQCRRMPPTNMSGKSQIGTPFIAINFPIVAPELWCGEYKPKESSLLEH